MLRKLDERLADGEISEELYNDIVSRYKNEEDEVSEEELEEIIEEKEEALEEEENIEDEESTEVDEETETSSSKESIFNIRRFIYIFMGLLAILIMFDEGLRTDLGKALGEVLYPIIGFEGQYPILTLMLAGTIMITFSTVIRDQLMDWVEMAENQQISSKFNKELMKAKRANKQSKVKKMEKRKEEMSKLQMKSFKPQLKSMAITMVVILTIFGWIWTFIGDLPNTMFSVPWAFHVDLSSQLPYCFMPFPMWIGVYMLVSLPLTQVLMVVLKMYDFNKRLKEEEEP